MVDNQPPAVMNAIAFLRNALGGTPWKDGDRLPVLNELAQMAKVSRNTMWKAIQHAKHEELLTVTPGGYTVAGNGSRPATAILVSGRGAIGRTTRHLLEQDIANGVFGLRGRLPQLKILMVRYRVSYRTVKTALLWAVDNGLLTCAGRGYSLPQPQAAAFRQRIVFITPVGHFAQQSALNQEHNRIINLFESECMRLGLGLEVVEIDFYDTMATHPAVLKHAPSNEVLGYVLDVWWYPTQEFQRSILDALARLATFEKPVSILDELGTFELPLHLLSNPLLQVYAIEGRHAGERIGRHLSGLGHRSAAFISILDAPWARARFEGVQELCGAKSTLKEVHFISDSEAATRPNAGLSLLAVSGLSDRDVKRLIAAGRTPSQQKSFEREWIEFVKSNSLPKAGPHFASPRLKKNLSGLSSILHFGFDSNYLEKATQAIINTAADQVLGGALEPLFNQAFAIETVTAWICANDLIAFEAMHFLRRHTIRVPQDISVTGFDNVPVASLEQRLTTLDFNAQGFVDRMLSFILRPPKPRGRYRHVKIEVDGIVIERSSTGKARSA